MSNSIVPAGQAGIVPIEQIKAHMSAIHQLMADVMIMARPDADGNFSDGDYGIIPGTNRKTLLQSGAEKICLLFRLSTECSIQETFDPAAVTSWEKKKKSGEVYAHGQTTGYYEVMATCRLVTQDGVTLASESASANSWEKKYIAEQVHNVKNTVLQMAQKRAMVRATRKGTAASAIFTQDLEPGNRPASPAPPEPPKSTGSPEKLITEPQQKRLFAKLMNSEWTKDDLAATLKAAGIESPEKIPMGKYEEICSWADSNPKARS